MQIKISETSSIIPKQFHRSKKNVEIPTGDSKLSLSAFLRQQEKSPHRHAN